MAVRISTEGSRRTETVRVEGHLVGEAVATLAGVVAAAPPGTRLELTGLLSADAAGVASLRELRARGLALDGLSPYLAMVLQSASDDRGASVADAPHVRRRRDARQRRQDEIRLSNGALSERRKS